MKFCIQLRLSKLRTQAFGLSLPVAVALLLMAGMAIGRAQYNTFEQRQQALLNGAITNFEDALNNPDTLTFWTAEAFFKAGQTTNGIQLLNSVLGRLEGSNWIMAGRLQAMIGGIDCYYRYGNLWDQATKDRFKAFYTTTDYHGMTTTNLTMLAAVSRYMGSQIWGESAFSADSYFSTTDVTGVQEINDRISLQVANGMSEFASRPYEFYNAIPLLVLASYATDPSMQQRARFNYEIWLAQSAGAWLQGSWAVSTDRSYPDVLCQQPSASAQLLWLYFGGIAPSFTYQNDAVAAALIGYKPPDEIIQAGSPHTSSYAARSAFCFKNALYQYTYMTPKYGVFSESVAPGTNIWDQVYPNGVMWNEPDTSKCNFLWVTDPAQDNTISKGESSLHTHGINGRSVQWMQSLGTFVMVRRISPFANPPTDDPFPYFLGYVPGGYQAMINDAANGRIYLYYNDSVMIAISGYTGFTWDPNGGIAHPVDTPRKGDSQFQVPVTNGYAALALETASPDEYPGTTAAAKLQAFAKAVGGLSLPQLTQATSPSVSYTDHLNQKLFKTYDGDEIVNGAARNYASDWPMVANPFVFQPRNGNLVVSSGNQQTVYDISHYTITKSTVTLPAIPSGLQLARGNTTVGLTWSPVATATSYQIQRALRSDGPYTVLASDVTTTHFTDANLANGVTYYYTVAAVNGVGTGSPTIPGSATPGIVGLTGTYYDTTTNPPSLSFSRQDSSVNFSWSTSPGGNLSQTSFSVHWSGLLCPKYSETYNVDLKIRGGAVLSINGNTLINLSGNHQTLTDKNAPISLVAGQLYTIALDFNPAANAATAPPTIELGWSSPSTPFQIIPPSALAPLSALPKVNLTLSQGLVQKQNPSQPGLVTLSRSSGAGTLPVHLQISGTAVSGSDYTPLSSTALLIGDTTSLLISPLVPSSPTGDRTVVLTVLPDPSYQLGSSSSVTVTIQDLPFNKWRISNFGLNADKAVASPYATPANDGIPNIVKYALNLNPLINASALLPEANVQNGALTLSYSLSDSATDVTCTPEASTDLKTWSSTNVTVTTLSDNGTTRSIIASVPTVGTHQEFIHLKVIKP